MAAQGQTGVARPSRRTHVQVFSVLGEQMFKFFRKQAQETRFHVQCARNFNDATRDFNVAARDHLDEMIGAIPLRDLKAVEVESPCEHEMMGRLNLSKKSFIENEVKLLRDVEALLRRFAAQAPRCSSNASLRAP